MVTLSKMSFPRVEYLVTTNLIKEFPVLGVTDFEVSLKNVEGNSYLMVVFLQEPTSPDPDLDKKVFKFLLALLREQGIEGLTSVTVNLLSRRKPR